MNIHSKKADIRRRNRITMKKVIEIFKRDISRLGKSPAAIIVAVGMCIIPALYAWFNIAANRDPVRQHSKH